MRKNLIISVLVVTNVLFIAFAIVQKMEADNQKQLAIQYKEQAQQQRSLLEQAMMHAQQAQASHAKALMEARQVIEQQLTRSQK